LGDLEGLGRAESEEYYFPEQLTSILPGDVFVDCGACDGDTVRQVLARQPEISRLLSFEPDPTAFRVCSEFVAGLPPIVASRIRLFNTAVGARSEKRAYDSAAASLDCEGDLVVDCVTLDEALREESPTLLKMDIEGMELDALTGSRGILQRCGPSLAICSYHRQRDLWQIPLAIRALRPDYHLFLRAHMPDGWQLVCYAIPPHRLNAVGVERTFPGKPTNATTTRGDDSRA
jgi:FkbM family methyltransferase